MRSGNKSQDTRNCAQNEPKYAICVIFATRLYYKSRGLILCDLRWQIRHNHNRLDDDHCDVTGHRKMSVLGTAGAMVTTHENSVMIWSYKGPNWFSFCIPIGNEKLWWASRYGVVYKLNFISNLDQISDWSVRSGSYNFPFGWDLCGEYRQPIAHVGGAQIYSPQLGQSNWPSVRDFAGLQQACHSGPLYTVHADMSYCYCQF